MKTKQQESRREAKITRHTITVYGNFAAPSANHCCGEKVISIKNYDLCVSILVLGIRHASCIMPAQRYAVSVGCVTLSYLSDWLPKGHKFWNIFVEHIWFSLQLLTEIFHIVLRIQRDIIINVQKSSWKYPLFLLYFNTVSLSTNFG
jgi:hypothetical protein